MANWLVAEAEWRRESDALGVLTGQGLNCYQPRFRERQIFRGRKVWAEHLLLGRFVLIELLADFVSQYWLVMGLRGIKRILVVDERPLLARGREVERLRSSEIRGFVPVPKRATFKAGDRVWVDAGPFAGCAAQFDREDDVGDPTVLVEFLGGLTPLSLPAGSISPA